MLSEANSEIVVEAPVIKIDKITTKVVKKQPDISLRSLSTVNIDRNKGLIVAQTNDEIHSRCNTTLTTEQNWKRFHVRKLLGYSVI